MGIRVEDTNPVRKYFYTDTFRANTTRLLIRTHIRIYQPMHWQR